MEKIKTRYFLVIGLLVIFSTMQGSSGYSDYIKGKTENPLKNFPLTAGEWSGKEIAMKDRVYRILETDAVLLNTYRRGQDIVTLSTVYYDNEKVDLHSPEGCSVGKGDTIQDKSVKSINLGLGGTKVPFKVNQLIVNRSGGTKDLIYYFFKSGKFMGPSYLKFRYHMGLNLLRTTKTRGALIILTTSVVNNTQYSQSTLTDFMESFYSAWTVYL